MAVTRSRTGGSKHTLSDGLPDTVNSRHAKDVERIGSRDTPDAPRSAVRASTVAPSFREEIPNMVLLVVLYMMQGIPLGLTMGSMPFLLASKASYTQIGLFSLASYPYSFKLLWSPIVDCVYSFTFGRRKSWIVPIQLMSAALMIVCSDWVDIQLDRANVPAITAFFLVLVLLAATQDIAVDGWALTLLSKAHVGYASTCQTVGMNLGYFASFTVFLALNDPDFCNAFLRSEAQKTGVLLLSHYLKFWGVAFAVVTVAVALLKRGVELQFGIKADPLGDAAGTADDVGLGKAYSQLWGVMQLPAVRSLSLVLVTCRLGMLPAEQAAPLKLLERGVSKEALAGLVLLEFPCELVSAFLAGRWATRGSAFAPWMQGYKVRLIMSAAVTTLVYYFPHNASSLAQHPGHFVTLALLGLLTSFTSTLMFTATGSFYNRISDPEIGGAYLTLLNTIANMGIVIPKFFVFALMDWLTTRECQGPGHEAWEHDCPANKTDAASDNACTIAGGECVMSVDGFYPLSYGLVIVGFILGMYFHTTLPRLEALPIEAWRVPSSRLKSNK